MPSFDVVSEIDKHEAQNAVDQANRELSTRFDFRGIKASFELKDYAVTMIADVDFQLEQMKPMLIGAMIKRGLKADCLDFGSLQGVGKQVKIVVTMQQGIDKDLARRMLKMVKDSKLKVQASVQGESLRIQGKSRDDLQQVMTLFKQDESIKVPLAFKNFKD